MSNKTQEKPGKEAETANLPAKKQEAEETGLRGLLNKDVVKKRFEEVLGKEGPVFAASILNVVNGSKWLQECDPKSILNAGFQAAAMKLPITPGLGQAAIVPYKGVAQFQIMVRGYIQLAHRSGQYRKMNLAEVHEGELVEYNTFTGEVKLDATKKKSDKIIGYFFFFELVNGYRHEAYWSVERCMAHGKKYSQSFKQGKGLWVENPEVMCRKTVVKNELAKWGPLNSEMRQAMQLDQAAIKDDGTPEYIDGEATETVEAKEAYSMPEETKPGAEGSDEPWNATLELQGSAATTVKRAGKDVQVTVFKTAEGKKFYAESVSLVTLLKNAVVGGQKVKVVTEEKDGVTFIAQAVQV